MKRWIAMLLTVFMITGMLPSNVFAETQEEPVLIEDMEQEEPKMADLSEQNSSGDLNESDQQDVYSEAVEEDSWEESENEEIEEEISVEETMEEEPAAASYNFSDMLARAEAIVNYTWVPSQNISTWNGNSYKGRTYFAQGEQVSGMPYTLFTSEVVSDSLLSLAQYRNVASSNYSTTKYCNSVSATRTGPVYGSCCATFVSEVFGGNFMTSSGNPRYDAVTGIQNSSYGTTYTGQKASAVQLGDALSKSGHIIWIGGMTDSNYTIYEQTPPVARKVTVSKSSVVNSSGYFVYDGAVYSTITRVLDNPVPPTPTNETIIHIDSPTPGATYSGTDSDNIEISGWIVSGKDVNHAFLEIAGVTQCGVSFENNPSDLVAAYPGYSYRKRFRGAIQMSQLASNRTYEYFVAFTFADGSGQNSDRYSFNTGTINSSYKTGSIIHFDSPGAGNTYSGTSGTNRIEIAGWIVSDKDINYAFVEVVGVTQCGLSFENNPSDVIAAYPGYAYYKRFRGAIELSSLSSNRDYECFAAFTFADGSQKLSDRIAFKTGTISQPAPTSYTLTYNANGGSGAPSSQTGSGAMTISSTIPKKFGYTFIGWGRSATGGTEYKPGNSITLTSNTTLYAIWGSPHTISSVNTSYTPAITVAGQERYYTFTPDASATYRFESTGSDDTMVYLYNSGGTLLANNDDGPNDRNFRLDYSLTAGTTYYLMMKYYSDSLTGNINLNVYRFYTVSYNANGGSGAPSSQSKLYGELLTVSGTVPTKSYTVTYNANGGSCSTTSATKSCTFTGWNTSSSGTGTSYSKGASYSPNANATLYAQWTNPTYSSLPTATRSGYTFDGWYTALSGGTKVSTSTSVTGNTTLYAHWTEIPKATYTISYNANGGTGAPSSQTKTEGVSLTLSSVVPTKSYTVTYNANGGTCSTASVSRSCTFTGWNTSSSGTGTAYSKGGTYTANASATLYAQWTNPTYSSLPTPTRSGYTFDGWYTASSGGTKVSTSTTVTGNITLYAHWNAPAEITANVSSLNLALPGKTTETVTYTVTGSLPATYSARFSITGDCISASWIPGWNNRSTDLVVTAIKAGTGTLKVSFLDKTDENNPVELDYVSIPVTVTADSYTIRYDANGGSGAPSSQTKKYGEDLKLTTSFPSYYLDINLDANGGTCSSTGTFRTCTFTGWNTSPSGSGTAYSSGDTYTVNASATLYAQWTNPTYGSLPTPTRSGYSFDGWYTASTGGTRVITSTTVTGNITLYAHWAEIPKATYTISYNANGGTGAPSSQTKTEGVSLTLSSVEPTKSYTVTYNANGGTCSTTSAPKNCTFTGWNTSSSGTGTSYSKGGTYTANAGATLYAQWTNPTYGSLPTPSRSGYTFDGWYTSSTGGTKVSTGTAVTGNITLYAHWTSANVTLTYNTNGGGTAPDSQIGFGNMTVSSTILTRFGYSFLGWSTSSTAKTASYLPGSSITVSQNTTLYAVWEAAVDLLAATAPEVKISYGGQVKYYVIRPVTAGSYTIESTGDGDTYGYLYDASGSQLHSNDDATGSRNFRITYPLDAGKTYYLMAKYYSASVTGSFGLTVKAPVPEKKLVITSQPQNVTAGINSTVSFRVAAEGEKLTYQWQYSKNGGSTWLVSGATGAATDSISIKVSASNAGNIYRCKITAVDGKTAISETAGVELIPGAVILKNPQSAVAAIGEYAVFTVTAENAASYQWQYSKDGAHWYNSGADGNKTDTLKVKGAQNSQGNRYRCVVTGIDGNKKKSLMAAMIVLQTTPKNSTAAVGQTATFSLKAEGIVSYQWQYSKDGGRTWYKSGAVGAETDTVSFKVTSTNKSMIYRCKLTTEDGAYAFTKPVGF